MRLQQTKRLLSRDPSFFPLYEEILGEIFQAADEGNWTEEEKMVLLDILLLEPERPLNFDEKSDFTHSRSPEKMLQFVAVQLLGDSYMDLSPRDKVLVRLTGYFYGLNA